jgi:hypothetical protein
MPGSGEETLVEKVIRDISKPRRSFRAPSQWLGLIEELLSRNREVGGAPLGDYHCSSLAVGK